MGETAKATRDAARYFWSDVESHRCYCAIDKARHWLGWHTFRSSARSPLPQIKHNTHRQPQSPPHAQFKWGEKVLYECLEIRR
jgi:hypothetical protein